MEAPEASIIAIIEDEKTIRETVAFALRREGYRVLEFSDGLQAWEALRKDLPDLAILDILLPGLEIYQEIIATIDADGMIVSDAGLLEGIALSYSDPA